MLTRSLFSATLVAGALMASAGVSSAVPMVTQPAAAPAPVETVGWRCGPGRHINRWGHCVLSRPVVRVVPRARVWHGRYWAHHRWHPGYWSR
ncbi:MAG: hypothetical protein J0I98_07785 [Mesorhizobium sp.]|nr:hypothetical protein [Mesorhizobium sp.]MBN9242678.1 hypothetical protein [Mesorhizobium sp.]